ncbi:hypothetical protein [Rhodococcus tukisamuensis]|uniref:hypothetical protein n=1 Tax=Rhodococcus tukisamuensis TaxID=168276 RepID=UPI0009326530|nr:hypothetical protein [Rhodococcus tukisamuensis]
MGDTLVGCDCGDSANRLDHARQAAASIGLLLGRIEAGELTAAAGTVARLEGAALALGAL